MNLLKRVIDIFLIIIMILTPIFGVKYILKTTTYEPDIFSSGASPNNKMSCCIFICIFIEIACIVFYIALSKSLKSAKNQLLLHKFSYAIQIHKGIALLGILIFVFIIFISTLYVVQDKILFQPSKNDGAEYNILNVRTGFQKIEISGNEGLTYSGFLHHSNDSMSLLIYFGGNAQNGAYTMMDWDENNVWKHLENYDVLMIDYPGYGTSDGSPSEKAFFRMADAVMDYANNIDKYSNIAIMGFSLGTGVANYVAANYKVNQLILIAPYENIRTIYNHNINIFHGILKKVVKYSFDSDRYAEQIKIPVLIIASVDDKVIPISSSKKLNECYSNSKFIALEKYSHNELLSQLESWEAIENFIA